MIGFTIIRKLKKSSKSAKMYLILKMFRLFLKMIFCGFVQQTIKNLVLWNATFTLQHDVWVRDLRKQNKIRNKTESGDQGQDFYTQLIINIHYGDFHIYIKKCSHLNCVRSKKFLVLSCCHTKEQTRNCSSMTSH